MEPQSSFATRDELWRLQESLSEFSSIQAQHSDRIMRLEKRKEDDVRLKNVWGPMPPFSGSLGPTAPPESGLNPAAEAFRSFDVDTQPGGLMSALSLDNEEDRRRGVASRANSVRFDESANNHYGTSSRQSVDVPIRTGSGLGSHPLSERSLSHRSDGRGSTSGLSNRANSFGLEQSRLLGSFHNSPKISGNPPPGFFVLGPVPAILRCWLTEAFSHDSLLYAAVCTGSYTSSIGSSLIHEMGMADQIFEESGLRKIKLNVYLTEARICQASSRSASPVPQVPTLTAKFLVNDSSSQDKSVQIILGSDVLRAHNADILLSQDKLMIFDDDRNQLTVPLVRPESDVAYKNLKTNSGDTRAYLARGGESTGTKEFLSESSTPGIIGRPSRLITQQPPSSPLMDSPSILTSAAPSELGDLRKSDYLSESTARSSTDLGVARSSDEARSATDSEKSFHTPSAKPNPGVWGSTWRSNPGTAQYDAASAGKTASGYSKASAPRTMKVLRPGKSMSNSTRSLSGTVPTNTGLENAPSKGTDALRRTSTASSGDSNSVLSSKPVQSLSTKSNPIGHASAFGWLNGTNKTGES